MTRRMRKHKNIATYPNGNLSYIATGRTRSDGVSTPKISERKLLWDGDNRLRALSDDGYVSFYWYDADGNRTVRERHGGEAVWVNSEPAGMESGAPRWTVTPGGFITFDGTESYSEHVYIGGSGSPPYAGLSALNTMPITCSTSPAWGLAAAWTTRSSSQR